MWNSIYNLFLRNLFKVKGRASRKEYLARFLLTVIIIVTGAYTNDYIDNLLPVFFGLTLVLLMFIMMVQHFPLTIRRLHDLNASGWYSLITFVPFGQLLILWMMFKKGTPGPNRYGKEPEIKKNTNIPK